MNPIKEVLQSGWKPKEKVAVLAEQIKMDKKNPTSTYLLCKYGTSFHLFGEMLEVGFLCPIRKLNFLMRTKHFSGS